MIVRHSLSVFRFIVALFFPSTVIRFEFSIPFPLMSLTHFVAHTLNAAAPSFGSSFSLSFFFPPSSYPICDSSPFRALPSSPSISRYFITRCRNVCAHTLYRARCRITAIRQCGFASINCHSNKRRCLGHRTAVSDERQKRRTEA